MAIPCETNPYLRNEHIPDLYLRLSAISFSFTLKVKHSFAQRNEVRDKVPQGRRMRLSEHWQQEGARFTSC